MRAELDFPQTAIDMVLEKYAEIAKDEEHKIHHIRSGMVHIPQMIEQLGSSAAAKGFIRTHSKETAAFEKLIPQTDNIDDMVF